MSFIGKASIEVSGEGGYELEYEIYAIVNSQILSRTACIILCTSLPSNCQLTIFSLGQKYILENTLSHVSTRTNMVISLALSELHSSRKLYPPFLKINNATLKNPVFSSLPSSSVNPITALVISIDNAMNDKLFADAVRKVIDNVYEEEDVVLMLYLIYERQNTTSPWRKFFQAVDGYIM